MMHGLREHGASASHVVGGNHDLSARERGVGEVDVDVSLGEPPGQLAEGCRPVLDVDYEDLALVGDPHSGALERRPASGHGLVGQRFEGLAPLAVQEVIDDSLDPLPGADLLWDGTGAGNTWDEPGAASMFPPALPSPSWPEFVGRAYMRMLSFASSL